MGRCRSGIDDAAVYLLGSRQQSTSEQGLNITRWSSQEYDQMYREAECESDLAKRVTLFIAMNDLVIEERVVIPILQRPNVAALNNKVRATLGPWEGPFWMLHEWYRGICRVPFATVLNPTAFQAKFLLRRAIEQAVWG
jgi:ABC-type oligopeptide transport system substrate-binding subunit